LASMCRGQRKQGCTRVCWSHERLRPVIILWFAALAPSHISQGGALHILISILDFPQNLLSTATARKKLHHRFVLYRCLRHCRKKTRSLAMDVKKGLELAWTEGMGRRSQELPRHDQLELTRRFEFQQLRRDWLEMGQMPPTGLSDRSLWARLRRLTSGSVVVSAATQVSVH
jgi:hypothetical protein